jgi:predicted protein tyrosine phosphatase
MRILVVCDAGEGRSVAMATVLHEMGHEAIACSYKNLYEDGLSGDLYLIRWSEMIFRMDELASVAGEKEFKQYNQRNAWIGRDEWANPCVPELVELCRKKAQELLSK